MSTFNCGERVRISKQNRLSGKVYLIKGMRRCKSGGTLYLLKSLEEEPILRLHYENRDPILERIY